jgi:hypothetical protein
MFNHGCRCCCASSSACCRSDCDSFSSKILRGYDYSGADCSTECSQSCAGKPESGNCEFDCARRYAGDYCVTLGK